MRPARFVVVLTLIALATPGVRAQTGIRADCGSPPRLDATEGRIVRHRRAAGQTALRRLATTVEIIEHSARRIDREDATVETVADAHAVIPSQLSVIQTALTDGSMPQFMPSMTSQEVLCTFGSDRLRIRQQTATWYLFVRLGTDEIIDLYYANPAPETFTLHWVLHESRDGQVAYNYGSWFLETVELDGEPATYVRYYARSGLTTRMTGAIGIIEGQLPGQVRSVLEAVRQESARRDRRSR